MDRHQFDAEDREQKLITETRAQFSTLTHAILAGEPTATKRITDALGDYLADDNAMADLVRGALTQSDALLPVITNLIWAEAGESAEKDVADMERARVEAARDERVEQRVWDHFFARSAA